MNYGISDNLLCFKANNNEKAGGVDIIVGPITIL